MVAYIPKRGDIMWVNFDPQMGNEIQKRRPALVLSPQAYNSKTRLALCVPITSNVKGYPFEVQFQQPEIKGAILCDQLKSLDWQVRQAKFICSLPPAKLASVMARLQLLLA